VVAKARLEALPGAVPKKKAGGKKKGAEAAEDAAPAGFEVLATFKGAELVRKMPLGGEVSVLEVITDRSHY
jgi:hypothetical protein